MKYFNKFYKCNFIQVWWSKLTEYANVLKSKVFFRVYLIADYQIVEFFFLIQKS